MRNRRETEPDGKLNLTVDCHWQGGPSTFCGRSVAEIANLANRIGYELGLNPQEAERIFIHLGDSIGVYSDGKFYLTTALCAPYEDPGGIECHIFLNRSLELYRSSIPAVPVKNVSQQLPWFTGLGTIKASLESGWEFLNWALTEEINHAQLNLKAGSIDRLGQWKLKYLRDLVGKGHVNDASYSFDLMEVTASRQVLQMLIRHHPDPQRRRYFRELYQQSLRERKAVVPRLAKEIETKIFVPTGYKTTAEKPTNA